MGFLFMEDRTQVSSERLDGAWVTSMRSEPVVESIAFVAVQKRDSLVSRAGSINSPCAEFCACWFDFVRIPAFIDNA